MEAIFAMMRAFLWAAISALLFFSAEAVAVSEEEVEANTASDAWLGLAESLDKLRTAWYLNEICGYIHSMHNHKVSIYRESVTEGILKLYSKAEK